MKSGDPIRELIEFTTDDRGMIRADGSIEHKKWSILFEEYMNKGKLLLPDRLKTKWHLNPGDLVYFDGNNIEYKFY